VILLYSVSFGHIYMLRAMPVVPRVSKKKQLGKATLEGRPKLFGGSIEEYAHVGFIDYFL